MSPIYVSDCPYDPRFLCHAGCKTVDDRPWWCNHRQDLYENALKESESEKQERLEKMRSVDEALNRFLSSVGKTAAEVNGQSNPNNTSCTVPCSIDSLLKE